MTDLDIVDTEYKHAATTSTELSKFMPVFTIEVLAERRQMIQKAYDLIMKPGQDYGVIPGTSGKPTLLKPGAEQLCTLFGFVPQFEIVEKVQDFTGEDHNGEPFIYYMVKCNLMKNREVVGSGFGSCSSWEKKYRYRNAERKCPTCGKSNIRPSKDGGFYCWKKTDGCGAQFADNDKRITDQDAGQKANPEIMDVVNTILKMSQKRALVGSVLVATGASAFFTQDIEDMPSVNKDVKEGEGYAKRTAAPKTNKAPQDDGGYDGEHFQPSPPVEEPEQHHRSENAEPAIKWGDRFTELAPLFGVDIFEMAKVKGGKPWQRRLIGLEPDAPLPANSYELACKPLQAVLNAYGKGCSYEKIHSVVDLALEQAFASLSELTGNQWATVVEWMQRRDAEAQQAVQEQPTGTT